MFIKFEFWNVLMGFMMVEKDSALSKTLGAFKISMFDNLPWISKKSSRILSKSC